MHERDRYISLSPDAFLPGDEVLLGGRAYWFCGADVLPGQDDYRNAIYQFHWQLSYSDEHMSVTAANGSPFPEVQYRIMTGFCDPGGGGWYQESFPELEDWVFGQFEVLKARQDAREREIREQERRAAGRKPAAQTAADDFWVSMPGSGETDSLDEDGSFPDDCDFPFWKED